ncbi:MAG: thiolase family protein, partial [Microthrixaceae bacterium]
MPEAVIVDVVRTAAGKRNGALSGWHPVDLAAETLKALVERNNLDPAMVDDVIMGCVSQAGAQALNIGRSALLAAGWPETVPATTIDRQCGSSQQAYHFAAQGVMAGAYDIVVAAGVESMSVVPMGGSIGRDIGFPFGAAADRYKDVEQMPGHKGLVGQGISAEIIANKWGISREELDALGLRSQELAQQAADEGRFDNEIIPVEARIRDKETGEIKNLGTMHIRDEGIRPGTTAEVLAKLKPAFMA